MVECVFVASTCWVQFSGWLCRLEVTNEVYDNREDCLNLVIPESPRRNEVSVEVTLRRRSLLKVDLTAETKGELDKGPNLGG